MEEGFRGRIGLHAMPQAGNVLRSELWGDRLGLSFCEVPMKCSFDKEWLERHADSDQNVEIASGSFSLDQVPRISEKPTGDPHVVAFGRLDIDRGK
jgi:hypothetical protein